jgi:hypothetical protein
MATVLDTWPQFQSYKSHWQTSEMGSRPQKWDLDLRVWENAVMIVFVYVKSKDKSVFSF